MRKFLPAHLILILERLKQKKARNKMAEKAANGVGKKGKVNLRISKKAGNGCDSTISAEFILYFCATFIASYYRLEINSASPIQDPVNGRMLPTPYREQLFFR